MRTLVPILIIFPFLVHGQYKLTGVVVDSLTRQPLPGANVIMRGDPQVVTDKDGMFVMPHDEDAAILKIYYIGFLSREYYVRANDVDTIALRSDPALDRNSFIRIGIDLGLYGDASHAPLGAVMSIDIQSIGRLTPRINVNGKFWSENYNMGAEMAVSKPLSSRHRWMPDNVMLSERAFEYGHTNHLFGQTRLVFAKGIATFVGIEAGVVYNRTVVFNEPGWGVTRYVSPTVGVMKVKDIHWPFSASTGLTANINYHPIRTWLEVGSYFSVGRTTLMLRYYNNQLYDGIILSLRMRVFSTEYYCCDSYGLRYRWLNVMR